MQLTHKNKLGEHAQIRLKLRDRIRLTFLSSLDLRANSASANLGSAARLSLQAIVHDATRFFLAFRLVLEEVPL